MGGWVEGRRRGRGFMLSNDDNDRPTDRYVHTYIYMNVRTECTWPQERGGGGRDPRSRPSEEEESGAEKTDRGGETDSSPALAPNDFYNMMTRIRGIRV